MFIALYDELFNNESEAFLCSAEVGRGDNLQLFISPLLKYEGWLYNIIEDKNFEINSLEPPCTGGLKIPHTPMGTCRNAKN